MILYFFEQDIKGVVASVRDSHHINVEQDIKGVVASVRDYHHIHLDQEEYLYHTTMHLEFFFKQLYFLYFTFFSWFDFDAFSRLYS